MAGSLNRVVAAINREWPLSGEEMLGIPKAKEAFAAAKAVLAGTGMKLPNKEIARIFAERGIINTTPDIFTDADYGQAELRDFHLEATESILTELGAIPSESRESYEPLQSADFLRLIQTGEPTGIQMRVIPEEGLRGEILEYIKPAAIPGVDVRLGFTRDTNDITHFGLQISPDAYAQISR